MKMLFLVQWALESQTITLAHYILTASMEIIKKQNFIHVPEDFTLFLRKYYHEVILWKILSSILFLAFACEYWPPCCLIKLMSFLKKWQQPDESRCSRALSIFMKNLLGWRENCNVLGNTWLNEIVYIALLWELRCVIIVRISHPHKYNDLWVGKLLASNEINMIPSESEIIWYCRWVRNDSP